jgi:hypothetical protein
MGSVPLRIGSCTEMLTITNHTARLIFTFTVVRTWKPACHISGAVSQLYLLLQQPLSSSPYATGFSVRPSLHFGTLSGFDHRPLRLHSKFSSALGPYYIFGLCGGALGILFVLPGIGVHILLITFFQLRARVCWVCYDLRALLFWLCAT